MALEHILRIVVCGLFGVDSWTPISRRYSAKTACDHQHALSTQSFFPKTVGWFALLLCTTSAPNHLNALMFLVVRLFVPHAYPTSIFQSHAATSGI